MPRFDGFVGGTYSAYSLSGACDRSINLYPEVIQSGTGPNRLNFYNVPGVRRFCTLPGASRVRALWGGNNRLFAVGDGDLYEIIVDGNGNFSSITHTGAIANSSAPAAIESNANSLAVYDGRNPGSIWLSTGLGVFEVLTNVRGLTYLDGYFVALRGESLAQGNQINISGLFDGSSWDELDFQTRSTRPDLVQAILADHEHLWLFGKKTTEVWVNEPSGTNFPFQRYPEGLIEQGIWAKWSLAKLDESMFWLGGDDRGVGTVWRSNGYTPQRVSNHAIENVIRQYALAGVDVSDAVGHTYVENGHSFYVLSFPSVRRNLVNQFWDAGLSWDSGALWDQSGPVVGATLVYDATTNMWHERGAWDGSSLNPNTSLSLYPGGLHAMAFNKHFIANGASGIIYESSVDLYDMDGQAILFQRTAPHINNENKMIRHKWLEVLQEQGVINGATPNMTLNISSDGGRTYGTNLDAALGASAEYTKKTRWQRLGACEDRVYRLSRTDKNRQAWVDAFVEVEPGTR
jgi:hypothetical protein